MPNKGTETRRIKDQRHREKAVDESRRGGRAKGKGSNQAHRRAKQAPSALWDLWPDAPSARCPSVPCRQVMVGRDLSANDHQIHRPSPLHLGPIESWCNADPPTPRWHTPLLALTLVATRPCVGRPAPPRIAELVRVRAWTRAKVSSTVRFSSLAAELPRTIRETAVCKPASSARPTVELAPWRKETCSCWQEEGSSIAAARASSLNRSSILSLRPGVFHLPGTLGGLLHRPHPPTFDTASEIRRGHLGKPAGCNDLDTSPRMLRLRRND
ncbi:hypothetical protein CCMA1212_005752 [Trichoderma ghanense]|uniref:Uncharacterized protein n=1 Tax=Trichoderma ghanense TaxID=65468 RepID=A0ABY2H1U1_9HYPO